MRTLSSVALGKFWDKVRKTDGCWLWTASTLPFGYGQFVASQVRYTAHRLSWELHKGPIPKGILVLHSCDTPRCVNPDHLFLGTQKDNMHDAIRKGRNSVLVDGPCLKGESNPMAKLTAQDVVAIRTGGVPLDVLAVKYSMNPRYLYQVRRGYKWSHIA